QHGVRRRLSCWFWVPTILATPNGTRQNMKFISILIFAASLSGCINTTDGTNLDPTFYSSTYYVERQPKDQRNLNEDIADELNKRGLNATAGEPGSKPSNTDFTVSYIDKWYWDMRMYLIELRIEVRNRNTEVVSYGVSKQSSLAAMGKSHIDVINRALDEMIASDRD
ncbi:MAG: hypothetical protein RIC85_05460, partial [Gammaproteobacteria bacterium]